MGDRKTGTPEGEGGGGGGVLLGWDILKGPFLGDEYNGFNNLSKLAILWNFYNQLTGGAQFSFN